MQEVTEEMKKLAFEILNHAEMIEEAEANNNHDLIYDLEENRKSYAEKLAELILEIGVR